MFRNLIFDLLGLQGIPQPYSYAWQEIAIALAGAAIFIALFSVFTRIYFSINRSGGPAKVAGWITSIDLAFVWLGMTLDLLGFFSIIIFPVVGFFVLISILVYVFITK